MKLTDQQKSKIISELKDRYDYMDKLPMDGWAWEFLRRNEQYVNAFGILQDAVKVDIWNEECDKALDNLKSIACPYGLLIGNSSLNINKIGKNFLVLNIKPYEGTNSILNKYFGNHKICPIPRPEKRYCEFSKNIPLFYFPQIPDYKIYLKFDSLLSEKQTIMYSHDNKTTIVMPSVDGNEDIFYIAVSKDANIVDLKDYMFADIAKILAENKPKYRQRKRQDRWKYYLIVYDLKKMSNSKISYDEIAEILLDAYPETNITESFYEARNIENWHNYSISLINGDFVNILQQTIHPTK